MILHAQAKRFSICGFEMEEISLENVAEGLPVCNSLQVWEWGREGKRMSF